MSGLIVFLTLVTFFTSALSGVFGMAGGLILMTVLLSLMPLQAAMVVHAAIQIVSNGWRCILWRNHIVWRVLPPYIGGMVAGFCLMLVIHYVPDKGWTLIVMGFVPLLAMAAERFVRVNIVNAGQTFITASCLTFIQMTAGVVGPLLDLLYNNAPFTRQQIVSTKALTQSMMHLTRLVYFGTLIPILTGVSSWPDGVPVAAMPVFLAASVAGTSAAALILHRITDRDFKRVTRILIGIVCVYCLIRGVAMAFFGL